MMPAKENPSKYLQFLASHIECPLCSDLDADYEFLIDRVAFSQCRACDLLFAKRATETDLPLAADASIRAALLEAHAIAASYLGHEPARSVIVGNVIGASLGGVPVRHPDSLGGAEQFDAIFMLAALERAEDPEELLRKIRSHLEQQGALVIMTPSTSSIEARAARADWAPLREGGRFFFSPDNLQLLATRCGFGDFLGFVASTSDLSGRGKSGDPWFRSNAMLVCRAVERRDSRLLSVVFPVYNEAATVAESLGRVLDKEIPGVDIEVIVVENNSTDGSRTIVEAYRNHPRARLVFLDEPRGKGFAVRAGLARARGDVILIQDADLEYDVGDYDQLVAPLFNLQRNFVLGSRHNARGQGWKVRYFDSEPILTAFLNLGQLLLVALFNVLYKQRLRDPFTMYKVFRRDCLYGLSFECDRFDFDLEVVIKLLRKGYEPVELAVNYRSRPFREGKKISILGDPPRWVRAMLKFRARPLYGRFLAVK